ncbi:hypothetical protein CEK28_00015 [Xenophilus sp. AP218F]|nr:hypothetical protein CEK28_00015 [Xenophilus sp. AP218F]
MMYYKWMLGLTVVCAVAGCKQSSSAEPSLGNGSREHIQTLQASVSRVTQGKAQWYELDIAVENSRHLTMPIFFQSKGQFVIPEETVARSTIDRWLKERAEGIAVFGAIGMQFGQKSPFVSMNLDE